MSRIFILVFALFLGLVVAGFIVIGAFPPHAHRQPVEHVLPNDKFH
jgi:Na+/proline symporter